MARQVLPLIDLTNRAEGQDIARTQQLITNILKTAGQVEQVRRERQQLDSIATAIAGGATTIEAINAAVNKARRAETQFDPGLPGILQRIGGAFQPPGDRTRQSILQNIVNQKLQQALTPKAQIPAGLEPTGATVGPEGGVTRRFGPPKKTKIQELMAEGYSAQEAKLIRDISHGVKPRASTRKHYDNMSDVEKLDFLSKLKRRALGQYYGVEKGAEKAVDQKTLDWVEDELIKLPMFSAEESTAGVKLDEATAKSILKEADGDKKKAREIARERGYVF